MSDYFYTKYDGVRLTYGERILYAGVIYEATPNLSCSGCHLGRIIKPRVGWCGFEECAGSTVLPVMYGFRKVDD